MTKNKIKYCKFLCAYRLQDNGYQLCTRYWPEEGSEQYHIFEVHLVSEHIWCEDYLVRSFYLKNTRTGETRTVTQFHFKSWPAHGVPASTKALLEFRRKVNKSYRGRACPIVIHCRYVYILCCIICSSIPTIS